jgi:hypothetical protein
MTMKKSLEQFAMHMREVEKLRAELKGKYGLSDPVIATCAQALDKGIRTLGADRMADATAGFAAAAFAARQNLIASGIKPRPRKGT